MNYQDNDTLNAEQQNKNHSQVDKTKKKEAMAAKLLASTGAGMVVGAGATYAAEHLMAKEENPTEEHQIPENMEEQQPADPTIEEEVSSGTHIQKPKPKPEPEPGPKPGPTPEPNKEDFFKNHKVKINNVTERTLEDGSTVKFYHGTVDGHDAMFADDGNGHIVAVIIDENDNGEIDDNEIIDLKQANVTPQKLIACIDEGPNDEVEVLAVQHDVDLDGTTVDVAYVSINNEEVIFVDASQNGEVDFALIDQNNNGSIDDGEVRDLRSSHIIMPTEDDITNSMTASTDEGMEDYSNNAEVTVYDV